MFGSTAVKCLTYVSAIVVLLRYVVVPLRYTRATALRFVMRPKFILGAHVYLSALSL